MLNLTSEYRQSLKKNERSSTPAPNERLTIGRSFEIS